MWLVSICSSIFGVICLLLLIVSLVVIFSRVSVWWILLLVVVVIFSRVLGDMFMVLLLRLCWLLCRVCLSVLMMLFGDIVLSICMWYCESSVEFSLNEGFLVVVFMNMMVLCLMCGRNVFCWVLLKWCILFMKSMVWWLLVNCCVVFVSIWCIFGSLDSIVEIVWNLVLV